jgi:hypothetical protein
VGAPLLPFVNKLTLTTWITWSPPRFGDDCSTETQSERTLIQRFAIALRQNGNLASSNQPYGVRHPLWSERPMHRRCRTRLSWHCHRHTILPNSEVDSAVMRRFNWS